MKHVAIYTRKSTDAGPDKDANSLAVQRKSAEQFIKMRGNKDWEILDEHFDDNKASGGTMDRPAMNRLIQAIKEGRVQILVIHRMDRISRSLLDFLELLQFLEKHGVAFICVTQNFDTSDPVGRMSAQMLLAMAEFERSLIRDRVTERLHTARRQGRFTGGRCPLGYNIVPEGRALAIDELEAIRVREIFDLYLELRSVKSVVLELRKRGWHNKKWITRGGKSTGGTPFSVGTLHKLLTNPLYIGKVTLKGEVFEGCHEGIVDPGIFNRVQSTLAQNDLTKGQRRRNAHDALLKGLLECKSCGTPYVHTGTKKKTGNGYKYYRYYTCANKRLHGALACPAPSLPAGDIENLVAGQLMAIGTNPDLQEAVYTQLVSAIDEKQKSAEQIRKAAELELNRITKELDSSREFEASKPLLQHLEHKLREAEEALKNAENHARIRKPTKQEIVGIMRDMQGLWPTFNEGEKCAFVKALVSKVEYDAGKGELEIHFNETGFTGGET